MKVIGDAGKAQPIKLVGGIFDGAVVDATYVNELAKLPSKTELLTQLLYMLNGPTGAFVRLLNAHREKQEEGAPAEAAPSAETKAEAEEKPAEEKKSEEEAPAEAKAEAGPEESNNSSEEAKSE